MCERERERLLWFLFCMSWEKERGERKGIVVAGYMHGYIQRDSRFRAIRTTEVPRLCMDSTWAHRAGSTADEWHEREQGDDSCAREHVRGPRYLVFSIIHYSMRVMDARNIPRMHVYHFRSSLSPADGIDLPGKGAQGIGHQRQALWSRCG